MLGLHTACVLRAKERESCMTTLAEAMLAARKAAIESHLERLERPVTTQFDLISFQYAIGKLIKWRRQMPELVPFTVEELQEKLRKLYKKD